MEDKVDPINELEKAFQDCITIMTGQEYFTANETDETKTSVENTVQKFLDAARQTEAFFLSKRLILSAQKPEQLLKEDIQELQLELERKEKLIQKHHEHLQLWINLLHRPNPPPAPPASSATILSSQSHPVPPQVQGFPGPPQQPMPGMLHQGLPQPGQYPGPPLSGAQGYTMPPPQQPPPSYSQSHPLQYLEQGFL
ncbi:mediator of RNA polymerase II transcription subunit 28-like isoform X2 [Pomacea canaliculata]|uniref:mediator of RNA polymerase II transcription subunit 28-like isoform X2 n=1 Tax=Pomacea canaliculata TaxID=400727 RepID=UPI000D739FA3|nr:mediator of RNA polymerase II transcription subunit 28-like isoform X2 [Pomacea canaliculata]